MTVGHGTLQSGELLGLLAGAGVSDLVDIRSYPGSRRHPQFGRAELEKWLPEAGIAYRWAPALGGRRKPGPGSPNVGLRNPSFRAYADHMAKREFLEALNSVVELAASKVVAVMCAESLWWRCHRRLLADAAVLLREEPVYHLFHDGGVRVHEPSPEAHVAPGGYLVYDLGGTASLGLG